jgi:hypothetical protein
MQNKGLIKFFAILFALVSIYNFLSLLASKVKAMQNLLLMEMLTKK